jgi:hypothetical protein
MKKKLELKELIVQSFITTLDQNSTKLVGGAAETVANIKCADTLNNGTNCISDAVHSLCQTCGIICE